MRGSRHCPEGSFIGLTAARTALCLGIHTVGAPSYPNITATQQVCTWPLHAVCAICTATAMRTHLRGQAAPAPDRRVRPFPTLAALLYPQSFGLEMSTSHHNLHPHPPQPEWRVYGFDFHAAYNGYARPLFVFSTQPVLHFPDGKQLDLAAKSDKTWSAGERQVESDES